MIIRSKTIFPFYFLFVIFTNFLYIKKNCPYCFTVQQTREKPRLLQHYHLLFYRFGILFLPWVYSAAMPKQFDMVLPIIKYSLFQMLRFHSEILASLNFNKNKELFENAPPHMIIKPYFQEGLYISSGQISKLIGKLTYIHVQRLTKPHEYYEKSLYTFASLHKSI